ncbi:MAG: hypothetical protein RLZZ230_247 [Candidatus Parcubacteria bacterium]|jgi:hypothetical protein
MDTFFTILKKILFATTLTVFAFMAVYIPQSVQDANAQEIVYDPTNWFENVLIYGVTTDLLTEATANTIANTVSAAKNTLSAVFNGITSFATNSIYTKEFILDGIAWAIAKAIISSMVGSLVNWINTGFKGSPAFVQDLLGTLLEEADNAAGQYIKDLGAIGSFICSPFKLDVQIALSIQYQHNRVNETAPADCSLSGVIDNIEGFLSGAKGSFSEGGWGDWLDISASPERFTPYGSMLSAELGAEAAIINAKGEKLSILNFGQGFLSNEVCESVSSDVGPKEECYISTPGKTIVDALSSNLDSGRQSLIAADEIDEIIGALLNQLANKAITGAAGLLGLSGGTGHTYAGYSGGSYTSAVNTEAGGLVNYDNVVALMQNALTNQQNFQAQALVYKTIFSTFLATSSNIADANAALIETLDVITNTNIYIPILTAAIAEMQNSATTNARMTEINQQFNQLKIYSVQEIQVQVSAWGSIKQ